MPQSGTALDENVKEEIRAFKMDQSKVKVPWMLLEIVQNDDRIDVVKVTKKAGPSDNLETLREELKQREVVYFVLDYEPSEEKRAKHNIPKGKTYPLTCFWSMETANIKLKMKYSSTVGTLKSATSTLKTYLEAHDFDDLSEEAIGDKIKNF
ncbi:depactin [Asterias amurensis]